MHETATEKRPRDTLCIQLTNVQNLETTGLDGNHRAPGSHWFCGELFQRLWLYGALVPRCCLTPWCMFGLCSRQNKRVPSFPLDTLLTSPWLLNPLTCGIHCSHIPNTPHSHGTSMAGTMGCTKKGGEEKFLSCGVRGNPAKGLRGCESPCAFCMTLGTRRPLVPGLGQSHSLLLSLVTTPATQSPAETTLANASTWNVK